MNYLERTLLRFLSGSKIKMEVTGFDMDGFNKAMYRELDQRLSMIQGIILEDSAISTDAQKVAAIKLLFEHEFYS